jgi:uncharacterized protein YycO
MRPEIGDYCCVPMPGTVGKLIQIGEWLNGNAFSQYQHVFIYIGTGQIVEAEAGGAIQAPLSDWDDSPQLWSTGKIELSARQRSAIAAVATSFTGTPYSFLDYFAIAAHRMHLPIPFLRAYIASTRHMICSQLVDMCYYYAGVDLFPGGTWPGYVTPAMLAARVA